MEQSLVTLIMAAKWKVVPNTPATITTIDGEAIVANNMPIDLAKAMVESHNREVQFGGWDKIIEMLNDITRYFTIQFMLDPTGFLDEALKARLCDCTSHNIQDKWNTTVISIMYMLKGDAPPTRLSEGKLSNEEFKESMKKGVDNMMSTVKDIINEIAAGDRSIISGDDKLEEANRALDRLMQLLKKTRPGKGSDPSMN